MIEPEDNPEETENSSLKNIIRVDGMYNDWFLDYASYVILERAVPHLHDGLKPVQRRLLHSLDEMDDGRYNKVANVIGNTMKYHPHGDASIGDALVQMGQKELLLDMQGNWGNILTGDNAAAPRYIEVRLNKLAQEVVFNPKTTTWLTSYDGRNKEPETLPVKFPLLLAQGGEGIAVGLACKILPHNFIELLDGCIDVLRGRKTDIMPDFPTGGMADFSNYNDGLRGGRVKVRARIRKEDNKTLIIHEVPFGTTTSSLIESILKANDKGKIKVRKIEDNTAEQVEIVVHLAPGVSPDKTIDGLYAFTDCEMSISPNACVIESDRPWFMGVNEMLRRSALRTKDLLQRELEIERDELEEQWHFFSLEKIFIENRIYHQIEECETWESVIATIHAGLAPHIGHLRRPVTDDDVTRLTEIKIKRITKFDGFKADERLLALTEDIARVNHHLDHLTEYAIDYFKRIKEKFGKGKERKTEIKTFDNIEAAKVAVANEKLYVNREEGFVGTGLKRGEGEFVSDCSDIDDVIVFLASGKMMVNKVTSKAFFGKGIIHVGVWKKGDKRTVYNCIYRDGRLGKIMVKRFSVTSITRDKDYEITRGTAGSEVLYFSANPNGEAEVVSITHKPMPRIKKLKFDFDFADLAVKGRDAAGNTLTKYPVRKVEMKEKGISTLGARKIWYDETVQRLNADARGRFLGAFEPEDKILVLLDNGDYKFTGFDLSTHFDENMTHLEKWEPEKAISAVHYDGEKQQWFVKRFLPEFATKPVRYITEHPDSRLALATTIFHPVARVRFNKKFKESRDKADELVDLAEFISLKGVKAIGNRLHTLPITEVTLEPADTEREEAALQAFHSAREAERVAARVANQEAVDEEEPPMEEAEEPVRQNPADVEMEIELPSETREKRKEDKPGTPPEQPTLFDFQ